MHFGVCFEYVFEDGQSDLVRQAKEGKWFLGFSVVAKTQSTDCHVNGGLVFSHHRPGFADAELEHPSTRSGVIFGAAQASLGP